MSHSSSKSAMEPPMSSKIPFFFDAENSLKLMFTTFIYIVCEGFEGPKMARAHYGYPSHKILARRVRSSSKMFVFSRKSCQRSYLRFCFILRDLLKKLCRYLLTFEVDRIQGLATLTADTSELPQRWCACKLGFSSSWIPTLCGKTLYRSNTESTKGRCPAHSSSGVGDVGRC